MQIERMRTRGPARVLIAGGGVAALETMLGLRQLAGERVGLHLLSPARDFVYRPLSVAEPFGSGRAPRFDLAALCRESGAEYTPDALARVDPARQTILTRTGRELEYDSLVVACGAKLREALPGAITFWGSADLPVYEALLAELETGEVRDLAFALPPGACWTLPLYELALMTARHVRECDLRVALSVVTRESAPLEAFGAAASERVESLLRDLDVALLTRTYAAAIDGRDLLLVPGGRLTADRVVALPRSEGPWIEGLPEDGSGFLPVDLHGRVRGVEDVYAAGDATSFPVKQGGLAAQQADAVAELVAARAGAPVRPRPYRPVLRGILLTGDEPQYLRHELSGGRGETSVISGETLWWPPAKIAGHYLAPFLAWYSHAEGRVAA